MTRVGEQPIYLQSGDPATESVETLLYPGQLGARFTESRRNGQIRSWRQVKITSPLGGDEEPPLPAEGVPAYWLDKASFEVTTDPTARRGQPAGVFQGAPTPGHYACVQVGGRGKVKFPEGTTISPAGQWVIPSATAGEADVEDAGTAAGYPPLGRSASELGDGDLADVDLDIPE